MPKKSILKKAFRILSDKIINSERSFPHVQLLLSCLKTRIFPLRQFCHRGRESVLHLPGDVRGGVPEGVGAGGEVGVCGR